MEKKKISITHQLEKTKHTFTVVNPDALTKAEVAKICKEMGVEAVFVNGKYYRV